MSAGKRAVGFPEMEGRSHMPSKGISLRQWLWVPMAAALVVWLADVAAACPTCKDSLTHDPATANLARGYAYSILFMLSMPPLIFSGLAGYFYWEVRRARKAAAASGAAVASVAEHSLAHGEAG
jgi:hypothetical protein